MATFGVTKRGNACSADCLAPPRSPNWTPRGGYSLPVFIPCNPAGQRLKRLPVKVHGIIPAGHTWTRAISKRALEEFRVLRNELSRRVSLSRAGAILLFGFCAAGCESPRPQSGDRPKTLGEARAEKRRGNVILKPISGPPETRAYDEALVSAVANRWYDLLGQVRRSKITPGKVIATFDLLPDGRVREIKIVESSVSSQLELTCKLAIEDPSPFPPRPLELLPVLDRDKRSITFTFYFDVKPPKTE